MESKYSKFLTILLIIIIVAIIILLGYLGYSSLKSSKIDQEASEFVQTFTTDTSEENSNSTTKENVIVDGNIEVEDISSTGSSSTSKKKQYKGFNVLGTIEIPKNNVSYPILERPSAKALEVAVAALYPKNAVLNSKGNVVIIGHNYRNGKFFSNNKKLSNGDKIYITDLDNNKVTYIIYKIFETSENDTDFYNRDTNGAREITLSTCTDDATKRTIIFAKAQGD